MNSEQSENVIRVYQSPPSYLEDFLSDTGFERIFLVYSGKSDDSNSPKIRTLDETQNTTSDALEVTGNPLEIDLKGNDTLIIEDDEICQHWSENENKHFPLTIIQAREYLNSFDTKNGEALFVVCDGKNPLKTVLLGVQESTKKLYITSRINILGLVSMDDEKVLFPAMERSHYLLSGTKKCHVKYLIIKKYFIYGTFLQNLKTASKYYGSVCIQTSTNSKCELQKSTYLKEVKLILQVLPGHNSSAVHFLWEELSLLASYLDLASDRVDSNTKVSNNPMPPDVIHENLLEIIVTSNSIKRGPRVEFDLKNIRQQNILDKLWTILKDSENLEELKYAFHYFFEKLAVSDTFNKVPQGNEGKLATIINGIIDGKLAVPSITHKQALEFLFELGAEKLKNDYHTISKQFYITYSNDILNNWTQLQNKLDIEQNSRKTRITQSAKDSQIDVKNFKAKLNYLGKLHIATEFVYLVQKEAFLPANVFDYFCSKVFENHVNKHYNLDFQKLQETPLCEFDIVIDLANNNHIVKERLPDFCSVRLMSVVGSLEAETVYVLSKYSIMPPTIYNDYDIPVDTNKMIYYAYKMECHTEKI